MPELSINQSATSKIILFEADEIWTILTEWLKTKHNIVVPDDAEFGPVNGETMNITVHLGDNTLEIINFRNCKLIEELDNGNIKLHFRGENGVKEHTIARQCLKELKIK